MAVLVTGGAGYIGSQTARLLRERGRDVVILDSLELGDERACLGAPLVVGDIADAALVQKAIADHGVDAIVHFAGYKAAGESMEDPGRYFGNNVAKTSALVDAARDAGLDLGAKRAEPEPPPKEEPKKSKKQKSSTNRGLTKAVE